MLLVGDRLISIIHTLILFLLNFVQFICELELLIFLLIKFRVDLRLAKLGRHEVLVSLLGVNRCIPHIVSDLAFQ